MLSCLEVWINLCLYLQYFHFFVYFSDSAFVDQSVRIPLNKMDKKEIVAKLTKMRQQYILNRSKKREEKKFKEETSQPLLSFQRKGNNLIVSGDSYSVRKINEAGPILEYLEEILLLNEAPEEGRRYVSKGRKERGVHPQAFLPGRR